MLRKINWRYALGELLIVICGISIAFALNNWAQGRQEKQLALTYLENIEQDIVADLAALDENIEQLQSISKTIDGYIPHLFRQLPGRDSIPSHIFRDMHQYVNFFPHRATYESMLHSGDLKLIQDFDLKNQIVEHYNSYEKLFEALERHESFAKQYSAEYFMKNTDHNLLFRNQQAHLLDDPYMKNLLFSTKGILGIQIKAHEEAKQNCLDLKSALGAELDRLR